MIVSIGTGDNLAHIKKVSPGTWEGFVYELRKSPVVLDDKSSSSWYVPGEFKGMKRSNATLINRSAITLDIDAGSADTVEQLRAFGYKMVVHSTYSHEPMLGVYKYRAVIPLSEPVDAETYRRITLDLAERVPGTDPASAKPAQLMFFPGVPSADAEYEFHEIDGELLAADEPRGTTETPAAPLDDPKSKPGVIGQFCAAYSITEAIEMFLADVYEPGSSPQRYSYRAADSKDGLVIYDGDLYAYSNHSTDPAATGRCLNAYDLCMAHGKDAEIAQAIAAEEFAAEEGEDEPWLTFSKHGKPQINPALLARKIRREERIYTATNTAYYYNPHTGTWKRDAEEYLRSQVLSKLKNYGSSRTVSDVVQQIIDGERHMTDGLPDGSTDWIILDGGRYNLLTGEYADGYDPDLYAVARHPVKYMPDAKAPLFEGYVAAVLGEDAVPLLQEWIGFCFYKLYDPQRILFITGAAGSGKSTLLEIMIDVIGEDAVSSVSLRQLKDNNFAASRLFGKTANFDSDAKREYLADADFLKSLTGDYITADVKNKIPITFRNSAKLTFAMNEMPSVRDSYGGFERRAIILSADSKLSKETKVRYPLRKIKEERSGIFNSAMAGLQRLLKNGDFTITEEVRSRVRNYMLEQDTVLQFLEERDPLAAAEYITARDLYDRYVEYCHENGEHKAIVGNNLFGRKLAQSGAEKGAKFIDGKTIKVYFGKGDRGGVNRSDEPKPLPF